MCVHECVRVHYCVCVCVRECLGEREREREREGGRDPGETSDSVCFMCVCDQTVNATVGPSLDASVSSPALTSGAVTLLQDTLTEEEKELWTSLGANWTSAQSVPVPVPVSEPGRLQHSLITQSPMNVEQCSIC